MPKRIVLAYSGGLDTTVILPWLRDRYPDSETITFTADLGQGDNFGEIRQRALDNGAVEAVVRDIRQEFIEDYCFPMLRSQARYEDIYLLGTSIARPVTALHQVKVAEEYGADAVAHGCTGKGNDQVRFELGYMSLNPSLEIISPWKDKSFELRSRAAAFEYAKAKSLKIPNPEEKIYSRDGNLWHLSHEGSELEDPNTEPLDRVWQMSTPLPKAKDEPDEIEISFEQGIPMALNGKPLAGHELVGALNEIAGRHSVGQIDYVESRLVGMKNHGVYETPGGTVLYEAHRALEHLCVERDTLRFKRHAAIEYAELVYTGKWFHPLREALQKFVDETQKHVEGTVRLRLFKGAVHVIGRKSSRSLYNPELASFDMGTFDVTTARGFIDLFGLPMKIDRIRERGVE